MLIVSVITQKQTELSNLASQLTAILTYLGGCTPDDAERIANSLAPMLLAAAVRGVEIFQKNSDKYYGVLRQLALQERAAGAIESLLATTGVPYKPPTPEDLTEVHDFVRTYLREMIARNADLVPQHFDMQTRVPIDKLYVAPCFQALGDEVGRLMPMSADANPYAPEVIFPMAHALRRMYRAVVLGSPGAGKTTLTQKIIHDLCTIPHIGDICVPFLVVLRKYEQSRPESHSSFVDYLAEYITSQLQIPVAPKTIHYLLTAGKAMVIFDGLDELLHLDRRVDISDAIQSFGRRYPESSILVTSRIIGYERAPLDRRMFLHMRLTNFDDAGVKTYVDNWFALNAGLDPSERLRVAKSFLEESASASELRSNPLLLSLMCNIFRGAGYIPQNRADLYERCALMLFEEWDHSRGIDSGGPLRTDARYALQDVAFWTLTNSRLNTGIPETELRARLTRFLSKHRYGSEIMAADAADELLRLWRGRAWILTDLGSDILHPIYQFTHKTFQEYFAATYLARVAASPGSLWARLRDKAISGQWEIVAQIAIQAYNNSRANATDQIYELIMKEVSIERPGAIDALVFGCRHLGALAPGPRVVRRLIVVIVELLQLTLPCFSAQPEWDDYQTASDLLLNRAEHYFSRVETSIDDEPFEYEDTLTQEEEEISFLHFSIRRMNEPLAAIFSSSSVMNDLASAAFDEYCKDLIEDMNLETASRGLLLMLAKPQFIQSARYSAGDTEPFGPPESRGVALAPKTSGADLAFALENLEALGAYNFWLPIVAARYHGLPLTELFRISGLASLFNAESPFDVAIVGARPCFGVEILTRYLGGSETADDRNVMKEFGSYVRQFYQENEDVPEVERAWLSDSNVGCLVIRAYFLNSVGVTANEGYYDKYETGEIADDGELAGCSREADSAVAFGAAIVLCVISEAEEWSVNDLSADSRARLDLGPVTFLEGLFLGRFSGDHLPEEHLIRRLKFSPAECELLLDWSRHEISFMN